MRYDAFPGGELVSPGLEDLERGAVTVNALLVSIGASRLRAIGVPVPTVIPDANEKLYALLEREHGDAAHSQYNALVRRLVSFERALESLGATRA
jgi:hypothetical protein